tara:strand:- start:1479 stop:2477 length:999 start_codon:yes stop_codon:yes gene_type:complete
MGNLKEKLPDIAALEAKLDSVLASSLTDFLSATHTRRQELISARRFAAIAGSFAFAIVAALYILSDTYGQWFGNVMIGVAMVWVVLIIVAGRRWLMNERLLAKEMNMAMVPILADIFDRQFMYTHNEVHQEETRQLLFESKLITLPKLTITSDDMYHVYNKENVSFRELHVTRRVKRGKSETTEEVFKGVFMVAGLPKEHPAETYVSTEGDRSGFAHRTFWHDVFEFGDIEETELEWNDFERDLHVASSDGRVAREVLTPDFMQDLHEWWLEHKLNIRIAFKGRMMYMLLPDASIQIGSSTTSTKPKKIRRFAFALAKPVWRSLRLFEDLKN